MNIALTGKFRSGKDTVAEYLVEQYGFTKYAFGDELKFYAHELFGELTGKQRELYQWFGQTMRQRDPDIWVRKCFEAIGSNPWKVVISDLRQPNEYKRCRKEGFVIIRVNAPEWLRVERAEAAGDEFDESTLHHETERYVDTFPVDYDVYNTGTFEELYRQIDRIMDNLNR